MSDPTSSPPPPAPPIPPAPPVPPAKKGMSTGCIIGLIVGIVGLVGLAVIAVLAAILVPLGKSTLEKARSLQAKAQMKSLEIAVQGYQTEYSRLPAMVSPPPAEDNTAGYNTTTAEGKKLIEILMGTDREMNPREIAFYAPPPAHKSSSGYTPAGGLVDIWGSKGYIIILDYDGDGYIPDPEHSGATIPASIIIYSAGPDGDYNTWKDNVTSWRP